jgi:hypothetical protein
VTWRVLLGGGFLAGIGFTMSLFVAGLAFDAHAELLAEAKIGILTGSVLSAAVGAASDHQAATREMKHGAIGTDDPVLGGERVLLVGELVEVLHQMAVVGMKRGHVLVRVAADLAAAIGKGLNPSSIPANQRRCCGLTPPVSSGLTGVPMRLVGVNG